MVLLTIDCDMSYCFGITGLNSQDKDINFMV